MSDSKHENFIPSRAIKPAGDAKTSQDKHYQSALQLLKQAYGSHAEFHHGQWECIKNVIERKRTLVVQKTGWGKSIVYFIATRLLRDQGAGPTLLVSPLLALMRNQQINADKFGVRLALINNENAKMHEWIMDEVSDGQFDMIMTTPEQLGKDTFSLDFLSKASVGLFVVDEAHCISDWGHDFRPDYRRIIRIVNNLPSFVPVLATTATANNRVVEDIDKQLGQLDIIRGPLSRESLYFQSIKLPGYSERLAWLAENLPTMPGSGIIYCLTKVDCFRVAKWLRQNGIDAEHYHSDIDPAVKVDLENKLIDNQIKVLVATTAISMGFDKPDLSFVIHYQRPQNLITYYQQAGRAGRGIDNAYAILLSGQEDEEIIDYFIKSAFPDEESIAELLKVLESAERGLKLTSILARVNISYLRLQNMLKNLEVDQLVKRENGFYFRTTNPWKPNRAHTDQITQMRQFEQIQLSEYLDSEECAMKFIANVLDDPYAEPCGHCSRCTKVDLFTRKVTEEFSRRAELFQRGLTIDFSPRKKWPYGIANITQTEIFPLNQPGKCLSLYNDDGWGKMVKQDKYELVYFRDELVKASSVIIKDWVATQLSCIVYIPSLNRPELVRSFAYRLADSLGLPCIDLIVKLHHTQSQKEMENSQLQCQNVRSSLGIDQSVMKKADALLKGNNVLLVDDIIDSKWTLTVAGNLLYQIGVESVYPYALAANSTTPLSKD